MEENSQLIKLETLGDFQLHFVTVHYIGLHYFTLSYIVFAYRSVFTGLRSDTEYVIKLSFVLSGRKLGSESYTILSHDSNARKISTESSALQSFSPKTSTSDPPSTECTSVKGCDIKENPLAGSFSAKIMIV